MRNARPRLEQVLDPFASLGQTVPQGIGANLALDQFLPQHALGDDAQPFLAHQFGVLERFGVQIGEDRLGYVIETFFCK